MKRPQRRTFLGRRGSVSGQQRVYSAADYLEIDDMEGFEVTRRRIFYDEILLVTIHSTYSWAILLVTIALAGLLTLLAFGLSVESRGAALGVFLAALPFIGIFVLQLVVPLRLVTVFGKRTRAQMAFWPRPRRARHVYDTVCRLARDRQRQCSLQQALRAQPAQQGTTPAPEPPPAGPS